MAADPMESIAEKLEEAIKCTFNPETDNVTRAEAFSILEEIKTRLDVAVPCGFLLASRKYIPAVRHYGLHIVETAIKLDWENMTEQDKHYVKENTLKLMEPKTESVIEEEPFIIDKVSRLLVEICKRMWPQLWENMPTQLERLAALGDVQTQVTLMFYTRLGEDVAVLQNLNNSKRRRDIYQALTKSMNKLIPSFLGILQTRHGKWKACMESGDEAGAHNHLTLVKSALDCLASYVEWVPLEHIFAGDAKAPPMLGVRFLLNDQCLSLQVANILCSIFSRKGTMSERVQVLSLLSENYLEPIQQVVNATLALNTPDTSREVTVQLLVLLKNLAIGLNNLLALLSTNWGRVTAVNEPQGFESVIYLLLDLSSAPGVECFAALCHGFVCLFRNAKAINCPTVINAIPLWLDIAVEKMIAVDKPKVASESSWFACIEFEDFHDDFKETKSKIKQQGRDAFLVLNGCGYVTELWQRVDGMAQRALAAPAEECLSDWITLNSILSWTITSISKESLDLMSDMGVALLEQVIEYKAPLPAVGSQVLGTAGSLLPFIAYKPELLTTFYEKLMEPAVEYSHAVSEEEKQRLKNYVHREFRRASALLLLKVAKSYKEIMYPGFDMMVDMLQDLRSSPNGIENFQENVMIETLVTLNNVRCNFAEQSKFVNEILDNIQTTFNTMKPILLDPVLFMQHLSIHIDTHDPSEPVRYHCELQSSLRLLEGLVRRSTYPEEEEKQIIGGFMVEYKGKLIPQRPGVEKMPALMVGLMTLIRGLNSIAAPEYVQLMHPNMAKAHEIPWYEMCQKLLQSLMRQPIKTAAVEHSEALEKDDDGNPAFKENEPSGSVQKALHQYYDSWQACLVGIVSFVGDRFFDIPNLTQYSLQASLHNIEHLHEFKLFWVLKCMRKGWLTLCPAHQYEAFLLPVARQLVRTMRATLNQRWSAVEGVEDVCIDEGRATVMDDVVKLRLVTVLTREYTDLLRELLVKKEVIPSADDDNKMKTAMADDSDKMAADDDMAMDEGGVTNGNFKPGEYNFVEKVSGMGELLLGSDCRLDILACLVESFQFSDTTSVAKGCRILMAILKSCAQQWATAETVLLNDVFVGILLGVKKHGQHPDNTILALCLFCYSAIRQQGNAISQQLASITGASSEVMSQLDELVERTNLNGQRNKMMEKRKTALFRTIVTPIVEVSLSEKFKHNVKLPNLPPMISVKQRIATEDPDVDLASLFQ